MVLMNARLNPERKAANALLKDFHLQNAEDFLKSTLRSVRAFVSFRGNLHMLPCLASGTQLRTPNSYLGLCKPAVASLGRIKTCLSGFASGGRLKMGGFKSCLDKLNLSKGSPVEDLEEWIFT